MNPSKPKLLSAFDALTSYSIGPKLRALRTEKGLTLSRLGAETGLSTALLSKLESGNMIPTLLTLARISRASGVDLAHFFSPVTHHSLAITRSADITDVRRDQPYARPTPLHRATPASRQFSETVYIPTGVTVNVGSSATHTELTAYVIEGPLRFTAAGSVELLETGDCIVIDTDSPAMLSALENPCRVLAVFARTRPKKAANL